MVLKVGGTGNTSESNPIKSLRSGIGSARSKSFIVLIARSRNIKTRSCFSGSTPPDVRSDWNESGLFDEGPGFARAVTLSEERLRISSGCGCKEFLTVLMLEYDSFLEAVRSPAVCADSSLVMLSRINARFARMAANRVSSCLVTAMNRSFSAEPEALSVSDGPLGSVNELC